MVSLVSVGVIRRPEGVMYAFLGSSVVQSKVPVPKPPDWISCVQMDGSRVLKSSS